LDIVNSFMIENEIFYYYDLNKVIKNSRKLKRLPIVLKILLEANLRKAKNEIEFNKILNIFTNRMDSIIFLYPSRIIMQDFTGIPTIVDLASMRDIIKNKGGDVSKVNPQIMVDLVIDHSLDIHSASEQSSAQINMNKEFDLNKERYQFAKWAGKSFSKLRVIPPGSGICHQINLEYLSTILHLETKDDKNFIYPETIVGTDSHTTMINSLGILAWGVSGIDAQGIMLGVPVSLTFPKVVGIDIHGELKEGITSSDLVLTLTRKLKEYNIDGKIVEFHGKGLKYLTLEDRSTISNMAPEYGAVSSFFAIDDKTISYFNKTRGTGDYGSLLKEYLIKQHLFYDEEDELDFDEVIDLDLSLLEPTIAGPKRPQDSVDIKSLKNQTIRNKGSFLKDNDIVLAAITSCSTTSNPYLLIHAALIAKKAHELGLHVKDSVKTIFSPGSIVVKEYLERLDLLKYLEAIGFHIIGFGCATCFGHSGDLQEIIELEIKSNNLNVCSVTSGNKNFEGKVHPLIKSNYLMSPSLVLIYALVGTTKFNLFDDVIGVIDDKDIRLKDLWPKNSKVGEYLQKLDYTLYKNIYKNIFTGNEFWQKLSVEDSLNYTWNTRSTYIQPNSFFQEQNLEKIEIKRAAILALFGDNVSTEQISPRGQISLYSPAAKYLEKKGVKSFEYNTFGSRRANSEVMLRGVFDNNSLQNKMVSKEGGYTIDYLTNEIISIYDKAQQFKEKNRSLVVFAGENFGCGVPRDWAVKGIKLLGIKAIIAKSFDSVYKSNLISMGVLPLEFIDDDIKSLKLKGDEELTIEEKEIKVDSKIKAMIYKNENIMEIELKVRLDNETEVLYYKSGGIFPYLLKNL
jgi:aconitate hydratase